MNFNFYRRLGLIGIVVIIPLYVFGANWYITTVDTTPYSGVYGTSIALDSLGWPHIAYCRYAGPGGLMYASWNPNDSTWILESVFDSAGAGNIKIAGVRPSLTLDHKDYPHISFCWGDLGYAWKDEEGWHTTHPGSYGWIGSTSLKLDKDEHPHIGYSADMLIGQDWVSLIGYTHWDGEIWHHEIIDTVGYAKVSLVLDSCDYPHLAYHLGGRAGLKYAKLGNGLWHFEMVDTGASGAFTVGRDPSMAIDSSGHPCIAYGYSYKQIPIYPGELRYAVREDAGWHIEKVTSTPKWGAGGNSLCFDQYGNPHVSYEGTSSPEGDSWLKHAWRSNSGIWYTEKIDSIASGGREASYTSLVIDKNDYAHISYAEQLILTEGTVKYATGYSMTVGISTVTESYPRTAFEIYPYIACRSMKITYILQRGGEVNVSIYNILGQKVATLLNEEKAAGKYADYLTLRDIGSGIYFCSLRTRGGLLNRKFIVIK